MITEISIGIYQYGNLTPDSLKNMKNKQLFYQSKVCTGCQLCVMACSLILKGVCGERSSLIKILAHPVFGSFQPVINQDCLSADCKAECTAVCTPRVLLIADENLSIRLMREDKWQPVMVLPQEILK